MSDLFYLYTVLICVLVSMFIPTVFFLVKYRQVTFVKVRGVWSIIFQLFGAVSCAISICLRGAIPDIYPCRISVPLAEFMLFLDALFIFERSIMLVISFRISTECVQRTQEKFKTISEIQPSHLPRSSFERKLYSWLLQNRKLFHVGMFSKSKLACIMMAFVFNLPTLTNPFRCCCSKRCEYL
jgi:hypothetical protein